MTKKENRLDLLWAKAIKLRDRFCVSCGKPTTDACHVINRRHKATRWLLQNGQGKCRECHNSETPERLRYECKINHDVLDYDALQRRANKDFKCDQVFLDERLSEIKKFIKNIS